MHQNNYVFKFEASTPDGERIYCVDAEVCIDYAEGDFRRIDGLCPSEKDKTTYVNQPQKPINAN